MNYIGNKYNSALNWWNGNPKSQKKKKKTKSKPKTEKIAKEIILTPKKVESKEIKKQIATPVAERPDIDKLFDTLLEKHVLNPEKRGIEMLSQEEEPEVVILNVETKLSGEELKNKLMKKYESNIFLHALRDEYSEKDCLKLLGTFEKLEFHPEILVLSVRNQLTSTTLEKITDKFEAFPAEHIFTVWRKSRDDSLLMKMISRCEPDSITVTNLYSAEKEDKVPKDAIKALEKIMGDQLELQGFSII